DCWWGKCSFCSWPQMYPEYRSRSVENVLDEIGDLIARYKVREIMDDAGSFPVGKWLEDFCNGMINRGYHKKVYLDCNMRFGALDFSQLALMKKAGFRLLLYGLESANQKTLDRINKKLKVERITQECRLARRAGLFPHITVMFGYPWESYEDALNTLQLGRRLLRKGYAYTAQATLVIPYPGTHLFEECRLSNRLKTVDWDDYDMKQPVMQSAVTDRRITELIQEIYKVSYNPEFIFRKLLSLRDLDDLKYFTRAAKKVIGHVFDFRHLKII
ncbi:MAG: radical SAM protein, partial [Candidatus Omnitrophica bacterium]|nr:radical SAM protein [Candidatus Omnitrophota bacterium]